MGSLVLNSQCLWSAHGWRTYFFAVLVHKMAHETILGGTCGGDSNVSSYQCCNCIQLESQLKESLNELRSVRLIVEILNDEIKTLNQSSSTDSNANPAWATAKLSNYCA
jgi:hypothetical protein